MQTSSWIKVLAVALGISVVLAMRVHREAVAQQTEGGIGDVLGSMHIDHRLEAKLDPSLDPNDPYPVFEDALNNPDTTVQWGWLDPNIKQKLTVNSGDTVAVETMMHSHDLLQPGTDMDKIVKLRLANPRGGPHTVTGPIYVNGADPGETLEIRIKRIRTKGFGANFNLPGSQFSGIGALNDLPEFANGFVKYFFFEPDKPLTSFDDNITLRLKPFPGTLAVGIDPNDPSPRRGSTKEEVLSAAAHPMAPVSTLRPWKNGSNMDLNELGAGSTVYIPIFLPGGLVWTGDSHCLQGNGEVNLTALECSYEDIVFQFVVREDLRWDNGSWLEWPVAETKSHFIVMGFADGTETTIKGTGAIDKAFRLAIENTVKFLQRTQGLSADEAYSLSSMVADCRITQVVDIRRGVHCMIPKEIFKQVKPI